MDNDLHGRVIALVGGVVDATERHVVSAAGCNVPELNAAVVRRGLDAFPISRSHTGDIAVAQVVRGIDAHCDTHSHGRDTGGPYTFASIWFHSFHLVIGLVVDFCSWSLFFFHEHSFEPHGGRGFAMSPTFYGENRWPRYWTLGY